MHPMLCHTALARLVLRCSPFLRPTKGNKHRQKKSKEVHVLNKILHLRGLNGLLLSLLHREVGTAIYAVRKTLACVRMGGCRLGS